ncbi:intermembrane transport protein PqiB [Thalassococcus sp. S3]|uniref:PqiB family protein n=1 Tax=Thalassococcus sp. S3 TaxID=2017482 RepID=UPI0010240F31|nr:MlaD family protein [Thalassococcus sp. S3]QBF33198.1 paraquat-inducible protein B [Thalassococcus sp. S3]
MSDPGPADLQITAPRRSFWRNLSIVWLVPVLALAVSLAIVWQSYNDRGVLIEIQFANAAGIVPGETTLRYRDVVIGNVEDIGFSGDLTQVVVSARIDKQVAPFLDEDATFWVVRPEVSARGITGLSTVLSGVYIEGAWDQTPGEVTTSFRGVSRPPLVQPGRDGRRITLRTEDGKMISAGAPVLFRGIEVGRLEQPRLTLSGRTIVVDAFIDAPHDRRINSATRFWDSSGFSISLGTGGLSLDVDSLASLVAGGIEFDTVFDGGRPVSPGYIFEIYPDEAAARRTAFARTLAGGVAVAVAFDESVAGLSNGAAVQFGGIRVGEVRAITAAMEDDVSGPDVQLVATLNLEPSLLGLPADADEAATFDYLEEAVQAGMRARLTSASLLGAELIVELVTLPDAEPAVFERSAEPLPRLPSVPSDLPSFAATAEGVLERINELPIEELLSQAIRTMASIETLASAESTRRTPEAAVALLEETRMLIADPEMRALPGELRAAIADLRTVVADLQQQDIVSTLAAALERTNAAAADIALASEEVPALITDLRALTAKANGLEAEELILAARRVLDSTDALIGTEEARDLPPALTQALNEVRMTLSALRDGGLIENANATMGSARSAADAVAEAASGLPALSQRLEQLVRRSEVLIAAYGDRSDFNTQTLGALREIKEAARAVSTLARRIERDPNSLLFGR